MTAATRRKRTMRLRRSRPRAVRAAVCAAALCLAMMASGGARAAAVGPTCKGHDLFPQIAQQSATAYKALNDEADRKPFRFGRLFTVSQPGHPDSYIFGTLHLSDRRLQVLAGSLKPLISKARLLILELADKTLRRQGPGKAADPTLDVASHAAPGEQADRLLTAAFLEELKRGLALRHIAPALATTLKPGVLALMLDIQTCADTPETDDGLGSMDAELGAMARAASVPVMGLETPVEQIKAFEGLDFNLNRLLLVSALLQARSQADIQETSIARYLEGDLGSLVAWVRSDTVVPGEPLAMTPPPFFDRLITERNRHFMERLTPLLRSGNVVVAIGADHLPGLDGLLHLVKDAGYTVVETRLPPF